MTSPVDITGSDTSQRLLPDVVCYEPTSSATSGGSSTYVTPSSRDTTTMANYDGDECSPLIVHSVSSEWSDCGNDFPDDPVYSAAVHAVETAIDNDVMPTRIVQGSSGSYFAKDQHQVVNNCNIYTMFLILFRFPIYNIIHTLLTLYVFKI